MTVIVESLDEREHRSGHDGNGPVVKWSRTFIMSGPLCRRCREVFGRRTDKRCQHCGIHKDRKVKS